MHLPYQNIFLLCSLLPRSDHFTIYSPIAEFLRGAAEDNGGCSPTSPSGMLGWWVRKSSCLYPTGAKANGKPPARRRQVTAGPRTALLQDAASPQPRHGAATVGQGLPGGSSGQGAAPVRLLLQSRAVGLAATPQRSSRREPTVTAPGLGLNPQHGGRKAGPGTVLRGVPVTCPAPRSWGCPRTRADFGGCRKGPPPARASSGAAPAARVHEAEREVHGAVHEDARS